MRTVRSTLLSSIVLLAGCMTMQNIPPGTALTLNDSEAIAVIGMHQRYRVHVQLAGVEGEVWKMAALANPQANLFPENGYIVVKLPVPKPNERYSIPMVLPEGIGVGGRTHVPCPGTTAPNFSLKAGAVNYVGHISYDFSKTPVEHTVSMEKDAAIAFLTAAYPELAKSVEVSPMTSMRVDGTNCRPAIYVPVFVPN